MRYDQPPASHRHPSILGGAASPAILSRGNPMDVKSSIVRTLEYAPEDRVLTVGFVTGAYYRYLGVPPEVFDGLMAAQSLGSYFHEHIRRGGFTVEKLAIE